MESDVLNRLKLEEKQYILLSAHREENIDNEQNFLSLMNAINALAKVLRYAGSVFLPSAQAENSSNRESLYSTVG